MRRKPSASHWVKKPSFDAKRPISLVFLRRFDAYDGLERERLGHRRNRQVLRVERVLGGGERPAVDGDRFERELVAIERERHARVFRRRVAPDRERRTDAGVVLVEVEVEIGGRDQERGRGVVLEMDRDGSGVAHGDLSEGT